MLWRRSIPLRCMRIDEILASTPARLLGRVLPAEDRGGPRDPVRDRRASCASSSPPSSRSPTGPAARPARARSRPPARSATSTASEAMAHLSCVGETTESLREIVDRIADAGIENVLALRGDPPRGETDFVQPEGGLASAAELAALISETHPEIAIGGACFPEVHPEAAEPRGRPRLPEDQGRERRELPDHPALLRQPALLRLRPAARAAGIDVPIIPGVMPITSYAQIARICELCEATIPDTARRGDGGARRRRARRVRARRRLRGAAVRRAAARGAPRDPLLRAQPLAGRPGRSSPRCARPSPGRAAREPAGRRREAPPTLAVRCPSSTTTATGSPTTSTARATARWS